MALALTGRYYPADVKKIYESMGSAVAVVENRDSIGDAVPDVPRHVMESLKDFDTFLDRAEKELEYDEEHGITQLTLDDARYPQRLRECADAPLVLYYKGNADLNCRHTINIIGTRRCTNYGKDLIRNLLAELKELCPETLVFSGLAYGVDICAHREALNNGFKTVGVVAHGLDDLYPRAHRQTANEMLRQGGLLTEYVTHTEPFAKNFVHRNRIVAGCADTTILVESASHGGGLITCSMANSYGRKVMAFPGAVGAKFSEGCNNLIRDGRAQLVSSAADLVQAMGWESDEILQKARKEGIQRELFPELSKEEKAVVSTLNADNDQMINTLSEHTSLPIAQLSALLFELEMKGVVKPLAGGVYHLMK